MTTRDSTTTISELRIGEAIDLPLPSISLGRRIAYQRIQRDAHILFGPGNYTMRADGSLVRITRIERNRCDE